MNYRNKCGYRGISAFLILLMLFIFVSCQTTPDQEAIQNKNDVNNDQISWKTDKDVYKIIYLYEGKINVKQISKTVKGTITTKYYGKTDVVQKVLEEEKTIKPTTEIISADRIHLKMEMRWKRLFN